MSREQIGPDEEQLPLTEQALNAARDKLRKITRTAYPYTSYVDTRAHIELGLSAIANYLDQNRRGEDDDPMSPDGDPHAY